MAASRSAGSVTNRGSDSEPEGVALGGGSTPAPKLSVGCDVEGMSDLRFVRELQGRGKRTGKVLYANGKTSR